MHIDARVEQNKECPPNIKIQEGEVKKWSERIKWKETKQKLQNHVANAKYKGI